jgi:hypothetical protein
MREVAKDAFLRMQVVQPSLQRVVEQQCRPKNLHISICKLDISILGFDPYFSSAVRIESRVGAAFFLHSMQWHATVPSDTNRLDVEDPSSQHGRLVATILPIG